MNATGWRPAPFLVASAVWCVGWLLLLVLEPELWRWPLAALLLNYILISFASLWPRSTSLGTNLVRLPDDAIRRNEIALTFDDGPDPEVTPKVLAILSTYKVQASFFCIGERAGAHPQLCRDIVTAGHAVENHGQRHHNHYCLLGLRGWENEVGAAQTLLTSVTGQRPQFFRPLAGLRNLFLDPVLQRFGIRLATWTRRGYDTKDGNADAVYARLVKNLDAGDILLLHDGNAARTPVGEPVVLKVLPRLLDELDARKLKPVKLSSVCKLS